MKVTICSCARCTAAGNEFLYNSANTVVRDLHVAYELKKLGKLPEITVEYANIMDEAEDAQKSAPFAKIDDTYFNKAKPEVLMEHIFDEFAPELKN